MNLYLNENSWAARLVEFASCFSLYCFNSNISLIVSQSFNCASQDHNSEKYRFKKGCEALWSPWVLPQCPPNAHFLSLFYLIISEKELHNIASLSKAWLSVPEPSSVIIISLVIAVIREVHNWEVSLRGYEHAICIFLLVTRGTTIFVCAQIHHLWQTPVNQSCRLACRYTVAHTSGSHPRFILKFIQKHSVFLSSQTVLKFIGGVAWEKQNSNNKLVERAQDLTLR